MPIVRARPRPRVLRLALLIAIVALATSTAPASGATAPRTVLAPIAERQLVDLPLAERAFSGQPIAPLKPEDGQKAIAELTSLGARVIESNDALALVESPLIR